MNKHLLKTIFFLCISTITFAQQQEHKKKETKAERKYIDRALDVQDEVWSRLDSAFNVTKVPDKYKDESAVIIAKSVLVTTDIGHGNYLYYTTVRERVLIKDKVALEEYSTLSFNKESGLDNDYYPKQTYIGAKIVKPTGKVIKVNSLAEEVLTENDKKGTEGKIAIPDLQVGDIIDYYYRVEDLNHIDGPNYAVVKGPDIYYLADSHPVLYYNVLYDLYRKSKVDVEGVNGAKKLETNRDDRRSQVTFTERDLPKIATTLWTSPERDIPYYIIRFSFDNSNGDIVAGNEEIENGPFTDIEKNKLKIIFYTMARTADKSPYKSMLDFYGGKRDVRNLPADSIANYFYNYYRWSQYGTFADMNISNDRNQIGMNQYAAAVAFTEMLKLCDISCDLVLVSDRYAVRLKDVFSEEDFRILVKVKEGGRLKWFCFNDFFQDAGQLLSNFQGENALLLTREGGKLARFKDTEEPLVLPVSKSDDNVSAEDIKVTFSKDNLQLDTINRTCKETGSMKHADQKNLLLPEDVEACLAATIGLRSTTNIMSDKKDPKVQAHAAEIQAALDKERLKQKDYFKKEINNEYDQDPKEVISYKINNTGLSVYSPAFEFNEVFTMDNFVKKAGNNFIFNVGKLMGTFTGLEKKDIDRKVDIYMLSARQLRYSFSITIPDGYAVKGVEELNKKVENDIASFVSTAKLDGNVVTVTVTRIYNHNFEPVAEWPKLVSVLNATTDFTAQKLLLEKK